MMLTGWEYRKGIIENDRERNKEIGQRIKERAQQLRIDNKNMAEIMGYSNVKSVSMVYGGTQSLPRHKLAIVAQALGVRVEYLEAGDGWKYEYDMIAFLQSYDVALKDNCLNYIRSMGYLITPIVKSQIKMIVLCNHWNDFQQLLEKDCVDKIKQKITNKIDREFDGISSLPRWYINNYANEEDVTIYWKKCTLTQPIYDTFADIGKNGTYGDVIQGYNLQMSDGDVLTVNLELRVNIKVISDKYGQNDNEWELSPTDLQKMISVINNTVCSQANAFMDVYSSKNVDLG